MPAPPSALGVVYDIDGLADPFYGYAAYRILFKSIFETTQRPLENCRFWDGDTSATLSGSAREYVIAVEAAEQAVLGEIHHAMSHLTTAALKAPHDRFLFGDAITREPLVCSARINSLGIMDWCETSFVYNAWEIERAAVQTPAAAVHDETGKQRTPD